MCYSSDGGEHEARQFLSYAQKWFNSKTVYDVMPSDAPPVQNSGNSHKPNIAALVSSTKPAQPQQQEQQQPGQRSGLIISTSSITPINQLMPSPAIKRKDSRRLIMEDKGLQKKIESNKDLKSHNIDVSSNGVTSITSTPPYPHPQQQTNSKS